MTPTVECRYCENPVDEIEILNLGHCLSCENDIAHLINVGVIKLDDDIGEVLLAFWDFQAGP